MDQLNLFDEPAKKVLPADFYPDLVTNAFSVWHEKKVVTLPTHPVKDKKSEKPVWTEGPKQCWLPPRGLNRRKVCILGPAPLKLETESYKSCFKSDAATKLQQTLSKYVGVDMVEDCYLTNLVKYPVADITRLPAEAIELGRMVLQKELELVKPDLVICLGSETFKAVTHVESQTDEYYGNIIFSEFLQCKVGLVNYPQAIINKPELTPYWSIDLRIMFNKHNPPTTTFWDEQDKLKLFKPQNVHDWAEILDYHLSRNITDFAVDTEFDVRQSWLTSICFKITISTAISTIDIHLYEPKQGYKPRFIPATAGKDAHMPEHLCKGKPQRMYFPTQADLDEYLGDYPQRNKALHVFVGEYNWLYQGTQEELAMLMTSLLCRPGNRIWGQNARGDYKLLLRLGVNVIPYVFFDCITLAKVLDESQNLGLEDLARRYLGAPSHKISLVEWLENNKVLGGKLPYSFIPRDIIDPYAETDSRRTFDLHEPLFKELERQHAESVAAGEPSIKEAYFKAKMPEFFALMEIEMIGQPINPKTLRECMSWYESKRRDVLVSAIEQAKAITGWPSFNPDSPDEVRALLFDHLHLTPIYTTDDPPLAWDEVPEAEKHAHTPSVSGDVLDLLASEHEICKKLNTCRILGTLEKNYLRRGARWYKKPTTTHATAEEGFNFNSEDTSAGNTPAPKKSIRKTIQRIMDNDGLSIDEYWKERQRDNESRSISQAVETNSWLYADYRELLETDRLATYPNVSAITKGEEKDIAKLVGEKPVHTIRTVIEPHEDPMDISKGLDIIVPTRSLEERNWVLIESDWTTGEVWYLVVVAGDENGIQTMSNPQRDVHASMARNMFPHIIPQGLTDTEIKEKFKAERDAAKPFVFGIPYGRSAQALVRQLNLEAKRSNRTTIYTKEQGEQFIKAYQDTFPQAWEFLQTQRARVEFPRYLVSPWGFRRRFPETMDRGRIAAFKREASNWQIQHGLACTMMEATKAYLRCKVKDPKMPFFLVDILHDATKFLCHVSYLEEALKIVEYTMSEGLQLPFKDTAGLRHSVEITTAWCGPKIDIAKLKARATTWEDISRVVPTAHLAEAMLRNLRPEQIDPQVPKLF